MKRSALIPFGIGKTSLARMLAAALGRACAWVPCGGLVGAAALHGSRSGRPGRIVEELRHVGVRNPVFVLDKLDGLDNVGAAAALLELVDPAPGRRSATTISTCPACSWWRPRSGLCRTMAGGGAVVFIEAGRMPGGDALTRTERPALARSHDSAVTADSRMTDPVFHRDTDIHLHVRAGEVPKEGASTFTGRRLRGAVAMTGEMGLCGQLLPVGGVKERVLAAHRCALARVILRGRTASRSTKTSATTCGAVAIDYVTRIDELLAHVYQR